jgi:hypothetical protein
MSRSTLVRLSILIMLVMSLGFAGSAPQARTASYDCNPPPGDCAYLYHFDWVECRCICDCPDPMTGECPIACN